MAKNISLLGADYPDVPAVTLPQTGGGSATFVDADWQLVLEVTQDATKSIDETLLISNAPTNPRELLFTIQRVSNGRTFASTLIPYGQFINAGVYAYGSYILNGSNLRNAVAIYTDNTHIEIAADTSSESLKYRVFMR